MKVLLKQACHELKESRTYRPLIMKKLDNPPPSNEFMTPESKAKEKALWRRSIWLHAPRYKSHLKKALKFLVSYVQSLPLDNEYREESERDLRVWKTILNDDEKAETRETLARMYIQLDNALTQWMRKLTDDSEFT